MTEPFFGELDQHLFNRGTHYRLYEKMGAHAITRDGVAGTHFAVWAPNAEHVSVVGDWNDWNDRADPLSPVGETGIWGGFFPGVGLGALYKYVIWSRFGGFRTEKADPVGFAAELRPHTASKVCELSGYAWGDREWMARRGRAHGIDAPISIYEVHLGSFMRVPEEGDRFLTYQEAAHRLAEHVGDLGFTHIELLPIAEHPLDASWGYQTLGHFAPTARFGAPKDFMAFVDILHRAGIGVLLDWVPAHFPKDAHGLGFFDGTHLYEHADSRLGEHQDWGTFIFNYGRFEVANYLISNAMYWLDLYHVDGLRVDAVASMIYRDYSRKAGEWLPNQYGGRENLEALEFFRHLNSVVYDAFPDVMMVAEESTAWPQVSRPTYLGGLGFGYKWDMGWMHDSLRYFSKDPIHRKYHHNDLTFRGLYAWHENYVLPLSHDEVVHGKGSLIRKMQGDEWQRFASLRLLYGHMYAQPAKKLLFMGGEIAQWNEWYFAVSLDWHLLEHPLHRGIYFWLRDLNRIYRAEPAMHEGDTRPDGFSWIDCCDWEHSIISLMRTRPHPDPNTALAPSSTPALDSTSAPEEAPASGPLPDQASDGKDDPRDRLKDAIVAVFNFTPVPRQGYRVGLPLPGRWREILNSDAHAYGGSGVGNQGLVETEPTPWHGQPCSTMLTLPPLGVLFLKLQ